jgi:CspA family cold shock protein
VFYRDRGPDDRIGEDVTALLTPRAAVSHPALRPWGRAMSDQTPHRIQGAEGTVKWFDPRKGFGFIVGPEGQDIFAHFSVIQGDGFRVLKDGSSVIYDAEHSEKGWRATRVVRQESAVEVTVVPRRGYVRSPRRS